MERELQILTDACEAIGIKREEVGSYRVYVDRINVVHKDGRKWSLELVNFNPEHLLTRTASKCTRRR